MFINGFDCLINIKMCIRWQFVIIKTECTQLFFYLFTQEVRFHNIFCINEDIQLLNYFDNYHDERKAM